MSSVCLKMTSFIGKFHDQPADGMAFQIFTIAWKRSVGEKRLGTIAILETVAWGRDFQVPKPQGTAEVAHHPLWGSTNHADFSGLLESRKTRMIIVDYVWSTRSNSKSSGKKS